MLLKHFSRREKQTTFVAIGALRNNKPEMKDRHNDNVVLVTHFLAKLYAISVLFLESLNSPSSNYNSSRDIFGSTLMVIMTAKEHQHQQLNGTKSMMMLSTFMHSI